MSLLLSAANEEDPLYNRKSFTVLPLSRFTITSVSNNHTISVCCEDIQRQREREREREREPNQQHQDSQQLLTVSLRVTSKSLSVVTLVLTRFTST